MTYNVFDGTLNPTVPTIFSHCTVDYLLIFSASLSVINTNFFAFSSYCM